MNNITPIVGKIHEEYLLEQQRLNNEARKDRQSSGKLWPTDMFTKCDRKIYYHMVGTKSSNEHGFPTLDYFDGGNLAEAKTERALLHFANKRLSFIDGLEQYSVERSVRISNDMWSGEIDFVIKSKDRIILVEHKATSDSKFKNLDLPQLKHLGQLCLYGKLWFEKYGVMPELRIFYSGWGGFAEYVVSPNSKTIISEGFIKGKYHKKTRRKSVKHEIDRLEQLYVDIKQNNLIPLMLEKKHNGCEFMGNPSCSYYNLCWYGKSMDRQT